MTTNNSKFFVQGQVANLSGVKVALYPSGLELRVGLQLYADSGNLGVIYVGDSNVTTTAALPLRAGDRVTLPVDDVGAVNVISQSASGFYPNKIWWFGA